MDQRFVQSGPQARLEEDSVEQTEQIEDADIPSLLDEIRNRYDISELDSQLHDQPSPNDASPIDLLDEANNKSSEPVDKSCAYCSIQERVEDVATFAKGQHLSMPGQRFNKWYDKTQKFKHVYKHHAIVSKVINTSGTIAELELIHFHHRDEDNTIKIYRNTKTYDLQKQEIYHVRYLHPRYQPDDIVSRAESMLPELRPEGPEHRPEDPEHRSEDPEHRSEIPEHRSEGPEHRPEDPEPRPEGPEHRPEDPEHRSEIPEHRPEDPEHRSEGQEHRPEGPEHRQEGPDFKTYKLASSNCEHFATWCVVGEKESLQVRTVRYVIIQGLKSIFGGSSIIARGIAQLLVQGAEKLSVLKISAGILPESILGVACLVYLVYCIVQTVELRGKHKKGQLCHACQKAKLIDLWGSFSAFFASSVASSLIIWFALPLLGSGIGIPLVVVMALLSVALQWPIPKIRRSLKSPFHVDRNKIESLSALDIGDIISFPYYRLEHVAVVTEYYETTNQVRCIHYALPSLLRKPIVKEESFTIDPSQKTVKLFDCSTFQCRPKHRVIEMARKRIGETKWSPLHRSDHLCIWAKQRTTPRVSYNDIEATHNSLEGRPTPFIREEYVHVMTDLLLGDVIKYNSKRGILVGLESLDDNYGRNFKIEMIVYGRGWRVCRITFTIDLDIHNLTVEHYHPAICYPMTRRVELAQALEGKVGEWWRTNSFIMHCILLPRNDTCTSTRVKYVYQYRNFNDKQ